VSDLQPRLAEADKVGTIVCPYCAVGCSQLAYAKDGQLIHVEGDPRAARALCPKGSTTFGWLTSKRRLSDVLYRAPFSDHWERRPLARAMDRIAYLVKKTRDDAFVDELPDGTSVDHTLALASLGCYPRQ